MIDQTGFLAPFFSLLLKMGIFFFALLLAASLTSATSKDEYDIYDEILATYYDEQTGKS